MSTPAVSAGAAGAAGGPPAKPRKSVLGTRPWVVVLFLLPALVMLGALVVYPIGYSVWRSLYDETGDGFVGLGNYGDVFSDDATFTALKNTAIWVAVAPALVTGLGLIFAVLTERVRWQTAFKMIIFMPMAISMLAAGIIFRLVYEADPDQGVANAVVVGVHDTFVESTAYPKANAPNWSDMEGPRAKGPYTTKSTVSAGDPVLLPLVGIPPDKVPGDPGPAKAAEASGEEITGTVWLDFQKGGGGEKGAVDAAERALPGVKVEAVKDGSVVASTTSGDDGTFALPKEAEGAQLRLPASNFGAAYNGLDWLGPTLVTPAVIGAYAWMWAGFAMVLIAAGLAGVDRNLLEAARVDGANEWQVFRKVTVPLLAPVLVVVFVTLMINVMKIFDLVYVIAPEPVQDDANVLALQLYLVAFGPRADYGLGSAIAIVLFILVLPVMIINIRRLRKERRL
ncbi:sugar ABC transporter permease [Streptomyces sp. TRM66268-LWL]|uniref:Sugar ABC transporter permease n=1 Tax=Streptomyces polyasparticus TaxID=2767826 RepID=A0ABR7SUG5_9ACTN|nr:sugar ABC transporter permease [Streptomyces polyasparticus]MBC9718181.1 sugar ABC transporter permease [Streptomyces polyasparticus]